MNSNKPVPEPEIIPDFFHDPKSKKRYERGRLLGKSGFAKCFELIDSATKKIYAGKIVNKKQQLPPKHKLMDMTSHEILIHLPLDHKHVVECHNYFEDGNYYAIVLELCKGGTLGELIKTRQYITEDEAHYFMNQLLRELVLKIGDFGLATEIDIDGKRKNKVCGTPNYMAPEILWGEEHGYEVDIWSMGCILYTLLVGHPPFETQSVKNTYSKIKTNEFYVPSRIGPLAGALIIKMLQAVPSSRPNVHQCLTVPSGPSPQQLLRDLDQQLFELYTSKPHKKVPILMDEAEDLAAIPMVWVSKWVNYSDKYGFFGYQLSDDTIGVIFNDLTKLLLHVDGKAIQYVERDGI
ncbi:serine/threonine-protein kinase PLK1-like [Daphnia pulicaria]|uniref:serine/threonine-protein kinase PLK1-like n=1 Tax=Daphnia pulicaria TaxID=35523 RepID=UPI001EEC6CDF|nr:serine/threonine-protein kinase PLK1-like [Daphnia pulicaria]